MAAYVDYQYYTEDFGGAAIPPDQFNAYALRASREVDKITFYRVKSSDNPNGYEVDNKVRNAVCAVADVLYKQAQEDIKTGGGVISSETVKSHTVSFKTSSPGDLAKARRSAIKDAAREYLTTTGLLYRGLGRTCGL